MKNEKELTVKEMAAMGGRARAARLPKKRRAEIARAGAAARWAGKKKAPTKPMSKA
jgi:hypothetical protein